MQDCLFCKLVRREIPTTAVYEDDHVFVFPDINPQAPTHWLIIPKTHTANLAETQDPQVIAAVFQTATRLANEHGLDAAGYRLVTNTGKDAGQSVFHWHVHLLAGRPLIWPPG